MFSFFKKKKENKIDSVESYSEQVFNDFHENDFLGKAAIAGEKAGKAKNNKEFDKAWKYLHEMKSYYLQHASTQNFTRQQTLALDSSSSISLADILRLECKHDQALVHILYWASGTKNFSKTDQKKVTAYFNRVKLKNSSVEEIFKYIAVSRLNPDFREIQSKVQELIDIG